MIETLDGTMIRRQAGGTASLLAIALALLLGPACGGKNISSSAMSSAALDDATITARVKTALLNDPQINATKINVDTAGGVVTMTGVVKSKADEARAVEIARQVHGVKDVKSTLQVAPGS